MNETLKAALELWLHIHGEPGAQVKYVEIFDGGCGNESTLDVNFINQHGRSCCIEVGTVDTVEKFLEFLVEYK